MSLFTNITTFLANISSRVCASNVSSLWSSLPEQVIALLFNRASATFTVPRKKYAGRGVSLQSLTLLSIALITLGSGQLQALDWNLRLAEKMGGRWPFYRQGPESHYQDQTTLKILLEHGCEGMMLEARRRYDVIDPATNKQLSTGFVTKQARVIADESGIIWGGQFPSIYQFALITRGEKNSLLLEGVEHEGILYVYQIANKLSFVLEVPIESYVRSIVEGLSSQMQLGGLTGGSARVTSPVEEEALAALAVAVRSHALASIARHQGAYWHVRREDVGYQGLLAVADQSPSSIAVEETEDMALVAGGGVGKAIADRLIAANFKGFSPSSVSRAQLTNDSWSWDIDASKLGKLLQLEHSIEEIYLEKGRDGQVVIATFKGESQSSSLSLIEFARRSGYRIESTLFQVQKHGKERFLFKGIASKGVFDLVKALQLASKGKDAPQILRYFFKDSDMLIVTRDALCE